MTITPRHRPVFLLLLFSCLLLTAGCDHLPFMPRQEIDSFPTRIENLETMEVQGVTYVRVTNPARQSDPEAEPAIWIPQTVYQKGSYQAYTANLPRPREPETQLAAQSAAENEGRPGAENLGGKTGETAENLAPGGPAPIPTLRRRALLFPTQVSLEHPEIITLLEIELEKKLPLRVAQSFDSRLNQAGRLLTRPQEIRQAVRRWLKKSAGMPPRAQFILFLTRRTGRDRSYFTCNWIDAQTASPVAAFTFTRDFRGRLWFPLVPSDPVPLVNLVTATPWWCRIKRDPAAENRFLLDAGHRSDLAYGRELRVYARAEAISDPGTKKPLGFAFAGPLGTVSVVDFFGNDGSLARARSPLPDSFKQGFAVEIPEVPAEKPAPETPQGDNPATPTEKPQPENQ
jgi:hypothetical protein